MCYQVQKYGEWGRLRLEPFEYLEVTEIENSLQVTQEKTGVSILVTRLALENQVKVGLIAEA